MTVSTFYLRHIEHILTRSYACSQPLLPMIPERYKIKTLKHVNFRVLAYREAVPEKIFLNECLSMHRLHEMLPYSFLCDDIRLSYRFNMTVFVKCLTFFENNCLFRINGRECRMLSICLILKRKFSKYTVRGAVAFILLA